MILFVVATFFLVPLIAGATVRVLRPDARWLHLLLSASGAFLLGVVFVHMLPELYEEEGASLGLWILGGFLLQVMLESLSKGIEHGHIHPVSGVVVPVLPVLGLCIHSFVEGIPFADPQVAGNLPFLAGVVLHKVPMAIALATLLMRSGTGVRQSWTLLVLFAMAAPLGILVGDLVGKGLGMSFLHNMLGMAIGMLLHIGATIIFESSPGHRMDRARFMAVLLGAAVAAMSTPHH